MTDTHVCPTGREPGSFITLVVDDCNASVLMKKDGEGFAFPRIGCPELPNRGHLVSECFAQQLLRATGTHFKLILLYSTCTEMYRRRIEGTHRVVFECLNCIDASTKTHIPPVSSEYEWIRISGIAHTYEYDLSVREDHLGLLTALRTDEVEPSEAGVRPWQLVEWFTNTTEVAKSTLNDIGYNVTGAFEQYQISPVSAVIRVNTSRGRVYLKASHEREGLVMKCVAGFAPFVVPDPLYVNVEEGWMLMNDYGETLEERFSRKDFQNVLMLHARLQLESTKHLKQLEDIGIPRQGFEMIMKKTRKLFADPDIRDGLEKLGSTVASGFEKIASDFFRSLYVEAKLPITLVHQDLFEGNIIKTIDESGQAQYVIFDWGCAEIDIPFSDVLALEPEACSGERERETERKEDIDAYLELWAEYGSVEELRKIMGSLSLNSMFQGLLQRYEYAKEIRVKPILDEGSMERLHGAFDRMGKQIEILKRFYLRTV